MKRLRMLLVLQVGTLFFALPSSAKAIIVTGESIDWVFATSDCVVAGTVVKSDPISGPEYYRKYELVTIVVSKTFKGVKTETVTFLSVVRRDPPKEYHFGKQWKDEGIPILVCLVKNDGKRSPFAAEKVTWLLRDAVLLGKSKHKAGTTGCIRVLTRGFDVLTEKDSILKYAEENVKAIPKDYVPVAHTVTVPTNTAVFHALWSLSTVRLILPVDKKLEKFGQGWCKSPDPGERAQGAEILAHFKNEKNFALLKSLLTDPAKGKSTLYRSSSENPGGLVYRKNVYYVRQAAFDALSKLGATVERPVLEELLEGRDEPGPKIRSPK